MATKTITSKVESPLNYLYKCLSYKALIVLMVKRELNIKYSGSQAGKWWLLIYPLVTLSVYTLISHYLFKIQATGAPYVLFAFSGIIPWMFFSSIVINSANVFPANRDLIKKSYFPKAILIIVKMLVSMLEMGFTLSIYFLLIVFYHFPLTYKVLLLPLAIGFNILIAFSFALWVSILSIRFKDVFQAIPLLVNLMLWLTPVFYPASIIPARVLPIAYCNPMAFVIDLYRFSLIGATIQVQYGLVPLAVTLTLFVSGIVFFI